RELVLSGAQALIRAGDSNPEGLRLAGSERQLVAELATLAAAERAVVALARRLLGATDVVALVAAVGGVAGNAAGRLAVRRHESRPVVGLGVRVRKLALLAEDERIAVERRAVRQVVARVRGDAAEAPRIRAQELGVRVDLDGHRPLTGARV